MRKSRFSPEQVLQALREAETGATPELRNSVSSRIPGCRQSSASSPERPILTR